MLKPLVLLFLASTLACASSTTGPVPESTPAPPGSFDLGAHCFRLHLTGVVAPDATLPRLIELTRQPAPYFVEPGRLLVREPGGGEPRAPISWWRPTSASSLELVLGGGYTGYSFSLIRAGAAWEGEGTYWADVGLEPTPDQLGLRLTRETCP
jgi:hypothetical protein